MAKSYPNNYGNLITYFEGEYRPWHEAKVHVFSPAMKYGAGVFEGIRGYWSDKLNRMVLFRLLDHLKRLEYSQRVMRFEKILAPEETSGPILEVMRRNSFTEHVHLRPVVYVDGDGPNGAVGPIDFAVTAVRSGKKETVNTGVAVQVSSWQRLSDLTMPTRVKANANYNNSRMASVQAKHDGYGAALMLNQKGHVAEGPAMCFFMVRNGVTVTPSITSNILESITRDTVIQLFREEIGIETVERDVDRSELYDCQEAFFCGTAWEVTPITSIDGIPVGDGKIGSLTQTLIKIYFDAATGAVEDRRGWLTLV